MVDIPRRPPPISPQVWDKINAQPGYDSPPTEPAKPQREPASKAEIAARWAAVHERNRRSADQLTTTVVSVVGMVTLAIVGQWLWAVVRWGMGW